MEEMCFMVRVGEGGVKVIQGLILHESGRLPSELPHPIWSKCKTDNMPSFLLKGTYDLKKTSIYFPNLLELSLRIVLAFPNDSRSGLASRICSVIVLLPDLFTAARYCMISLVASVLPAPDSPLENKGKSVQ